MVLLIAEKSVTVGCRKVATTSAAMQLRASLLLAPNVPMACAAIAVAARYIPLNLLISADQPNRAVTCQKSAMANQRTVDETWRSKTELSASRAFPTASMVSAMLAKSSANYCGGLLVKLPITAVINTTWTLVLAETVVSTRFVESICPVRPKRTSSVGVFIARIEMKSSSMDRKGLPSSLNQSNTARAN